MKFVARFYQRISGNLKFEKEKTFDFKVLEIKKNKTKPIYVFRYQKKSFVFTVSAIRTLSKKGYPTINYAMDNAIPYDGKITVTPLNEEGNPDSKQSVYEQKIATDALDTVFAQGEMKSVIMGSQKPKDEMDKKSLIIGFIMGGGVIFAVITILTANGVHI